MTRSGRAALRRLRQWHRDLGIGKSEFARLLGVSQPTLSRVLAGKRNVGPLTAMRIQVKSNDWEHGPILASEWNGSFQWNIGQGGAEQAPERAAS